jgi:subtilisin family serine protease
MSIANLDLINLTNLMDLTKGISKIKIGLIDGPVALDHENLAGMKAEEIHGNQMACARSKSSACAHGTFVAGILAGRRNPLAPAICPDCTFLLRPIFSEQSEVPRATAEELSTAIVDCIDGGAKVVNLSVALNGHSRGRKDLKEALDYSARKGAIIVAAAGNQGTIGSSTVTAHPWVISVVGCNQQGRPIAESNLGSSSGKWGLMAPGQDIWSLSSQGGYNTMSGTSVAVPFVSGTIGLLWSMFPGSSAALIRSLFKEDGMARRSLVPPLLDAWRAYQMLGKNVNGVRIIRQGRNINGTK